MENLQKMDLPIQDILQFILGKVSPTHSVLVGVDGGAGAGKTTFADWLAEVILKTMTPAAVVRTDAFCRPSAERVDRRFPLAVVADMDWERLRDQVFVPLRAGKPARFQLYDWPDDSLKGWMTIESGGVTIVDGVAATRTELSTYYDLRIWLACPRAVRITRLLRRRDTSASKIEHWLPSEDHYIAAHAPERGAHLVIDTSAGLPLEDGTGWFTTRWSPPRTTP